MILFGSRARGDHDAESDWDLCVVLNDDIPPEVYTPGAMWQAVRGLGLTIQVVPMRKSVFEAARVEINAVAHDVAQDRCRPFRRGEDNAMTSGTSDPWEWVHKARQDARSARRLLPAPPELEVAADHLQQAVEKAIKALLTAGGSGIRAARARDTTWMRLRASSP